MTSILRKLVANRSLLKNLVVRDLKQRYVGSIGGWLWSVIRPIFFFCGFLPWLLFSDTVMRNCSAITDNAPLITKTVIPAEILPVSITISNLVHHLIGLAILIAALGFFYDVHLSALWILLYMPMLLMFAQGLGWIVAGLHVFVRDTIQGLEILLFLWLWFTPVFYSGVLVPARIRYLFNLNPMAIIVTGYRNSLL